MTSRGRIRDGQMIDTPHSVVFRGAQTLSCTVIVSIEALADMEDDRMGGSSRIGVTKASLRRGGNS